MRGCALSHHEWCLLLILTLSAMLPGAAVTLERQFSADLQYSGSSTGCACGHIYLRCCSKCIGHARKLYDQGHWRDEQEDAPTCSGP